MIEHLSYALLGLGSGAALAMLATGVVLTNRASGLVNIGHAAVGMHLAFVFYEFRETGDLVLPVVGLPDRVHLLPVPTVATALALLVAYGALFGAVLHTLIFRRLRDAPPLARVVASIGLFLYLWATTGLRFPTSPAIRPILPRGGVELAGRFVGSDRITAAGIAVVLTAAIWALSRFTRFGLATTAAAENRRGAQLSGIDPERIALVNWMLATVLAGLAMVIVAPFNQLDPLNLSLLVVPAMAAALLGGFRSYPLVALAALGLGMAESLLVDLQSEWKAVSGLGLQQGLPFVVILGVLAARGRSLPTRGEPNSDRLPPSPEPRRVAPTAVVIGACAVLIMAVAGSDWRMAIITSAIAALISLSVVVLTGYVGQISLAPYAFAGVAAFSMVRFTEAGLPALVASVAAVFATTLLGVAVGVPAVGVRGMNLAIATLGAAVAIEELVFQWRWFVDTADGVPSIDLGPLELGIAARGDAYPRVAFGMFTVVVVAVAAVAVANLRRGATGLSWLAVRSNERAAAAAGIDVRGAKLSAFAISAVLAGSGGVMLAFQRQSVSVASFGVFLSLAVLALTYLSGIASIGGALLAGVLAPTGVLTIATGQDLTTTSPYSFVVNGALLVLVAVAAPGGVTGAARQVARSARDRRAGPPVGGHPGHRAQREAASDAARANASGASSSSQ